MKPYMVRTLFAFVLAVTYLLPEASEAQAASWHSPSGHVAWTIDPICRDGIKITMRHIVTNPADWNMSRTESQAFAAHSPLLFTVGQEIPSQPQRLTGSPLLGTTYGQATVTIKRHLLPLRWTTDYGYQGSSYVYGIVRMKWFGLSNTPELSLGTPVIVKYANTFGSFDYFFGAVTNCRLF